MENQFETLPIQYLLIGDVSSNKIITEFSTNNNSHQIKKEINQIFVKICKTQHKKYNERNKIMSKDSIYYYTIEEPNIIFIILVEEEYSEDLVFELIDKIKKEEIVKMINEETQELNPKGRVELKNIIDLYQKKNYDDNENEKDNNNDDNNNKDYKDNVNIKVNEKIENNYNNNNSDKKDIIENIDDLQTKTDEFLLTNNKKKWDIRDIKNIKNYKIWKNYRTWLYLAGIILIILIIELLI